MTFCTLIYIYIYLYNLRIINLVLFPECNELTLTMNISMWFEVNSLVCREKTPNLIESREPVSFPGQPGAK